MSQSQENKLSRKIIKDSNGNKKTVWVKNLNKKNPEGFDLEGELHFKGLDIKIENEKGSVRSGTSDNGKKWSTKMLYPYGYISRTMGTDGDHVDVFVGDNEKSDKVFIVHQVVPETGKHDEDKVMLGFDNAKQAKKAYLAHYDSPKFFGSMTEMTFEKFKESLKKHKGKKLKKSFYEQEQFSTESHNQ